MSFITAFRKIIGHPFNRSHPLRTLLFMVFWKINQNLFHLPMLIEITAGIFCICYPETAYGTLVAQMRYPEFWEMMFLEKILQTNDIFFDVGANMGSWSLVAASKITRGKIFDFEPSLHSLNNLRQNIRINHLENRVTVIAKAVSNKVGRISFTMEDIGDTSHISYGKNPETSTVKVSSTSIDNFVKQTKIKSIDIMKIDVEGAEHQVLEGCLANLKRHRIGIVILEINFHSSEFGFTGQDTLSLLTSVGYKIFSFDTKGKLQPLQKVEFAGRNMFNVIAIAPLAKYQRRCQPFLSDTINP